MLIMETAGYSGPIGANISRKYLLSHPTDRPTHPGGVEGEPERKFDRHQHLIEFGVRMRTGQPSMHVPHIICRPVDDVAGFPRFWPNFTPLCAPFRPLTYSFSADDPICYLSSLQPYDVGSHGKGCLDNHYLAVLTSVLGL
jgi:hypothetical protein